MSEPRTAFGYVTTPRGKAFATGGYGVDGQMLASADEYNLTLDSWLPSRNSMKEPKANVVVHAPSNNAACIVSFAVSCCFCSRRPFTGCEMSTIRPIR